MKKYFLAFIMLLVMGAVIAQPGKKPVQKPPTQSDTDKAMEEAMKGMTEEEKAEMRKLMKNVMPEVTGQNSKMADYPEFTSNKQLVPKKDIVRINAIPKKKLVQADMSGYATNLYNKIMTKGDAAEIALVKKIIAQTPKANAIGGAAVLCMLQGHPQAALALSMKAVQTDPSNDNWQNNMASLLTQYGYPEQAIPVLQKLKIQFPKNSTVLNNLGQAWLGLGEIDSAMTNIKRAGGLNPNHPEAKETEGVIEETKGNTEKATEDYIKAMENSVNPFTEKLINNNNGQDKLAKINFEKLKRSITIYEYFPKDWIIIPKLSDNVSEYESDIRIKNGYSEMFEKLIPKIDSMAAASSVEMEVLLEKSELMGADSTKYFIKGFMEDLSKEPSFMDKPAVIVQNILQAYLHQWLIDTRKEGQNLTDNIDAQRKVMTKGGNDDKCSVIDRRNNQFLVYANPLIRKFHAKNIEEFRVWLNAFCTWSWYLGNPKNVILSACISWTAVFISMHRESVNGQFDQSSACKAQNTDGVDNIPEPVIPNFTCPAVVSIPVGADWQQLSNASNFDNNEYGVKKNPANPIPNNTTSYGADQNGIAEPGKDPFTKSASGSLSPGMINEYDPGKMLEDYEYTEDLTPLPNIPSDDLTPLPDLEKSKLAKELLKKMMQGDCSKVKDQKQVLREKIKQMADEMEAGSEKTADKANMKQTLQNVEKNGLQPSLSSALQAPGTFTPVKGLFN